jgi:phage internal scaffolding protein
MAKLAIQKAMRLDNKARPVIDTGPGKTEQCHAQECDMNYILRDYQRSGLVRHANRNQGRYDDVSAVDFQSAMDTVTTAQRMFDDLPSNIRKRFANNPTNFLEFVSDPSNREEMIQLGMIVGNDGKDKAGDPVPSPVPDPVPDPE